MNIAITDAYYSTPDGDSIAVVVDGVPFHLNPDHPHEDDPWISALLAWQIDGGVIRPYAPPKLEQIKAHLKAQVDAAAERERARYITPGAGQAMTYQAKADEARRLAGDPSPDPADYPLLSAEVGIAAPDLASVGAVVLAAHQAWQMIGAGIEAARLGAKQAIELAEDEVGARAAAEVVWPG